MQQVTNTSGAGWWKIPLRLMVFLVLAFAVGAVMNRLAVSLNGTTGPAGFGRGVLQGALMPMSMPNLLVGRDVSIYSTNNTGVSYKLGYTVGVNVCGAAFFGVFYWRLNRWRKRASNHFGGKQRTMECQVAVGSQRSRRD